MLTEDITFFLWEVKCDRCKKARIFYFEDVNTKKELLEELIAEGWKITEDNEHICKGCANGRKHS